MASKSLMFAIRTNHPTRKVVDKVLYNRFGKPVESVMDVDHDADFVDMQASYTPRQVAAWMKTARVAFCMEDGKFYPVKDENELVEQFKTAVEEDTITLTEDSNFGIRKPEFYITDPITGGETEVSDVLGKRLAEIQYDVEVRNNIISGTVVKVTDFTGFNGQDVHEQNGYYLVFYIKKADMEAEPIAAYTDIKFLVAGGSGNEVEPDEGMNIIFLGATEEEARGKKLMIKAHATVDNEKFGQYEAEVSAVFDLELRFDDRDISVTGPLSKEYINLDKDIMDPRELESGRITIPEILPEEPPVEEDVSDDTESDTGEEETPTEDEETTVDESTPEVTE